MILAFSQCLFCQILVAYLVWANMWDWKDVTWKGREIRNVSTCPIFQKVSWKVSQSWRGPISPLHCVICFFIELYYCQCNIKNKSTEKTHVVKHVLGWILVRQMWAVLRLFPGNSVISPQPDFTDQLQIRCELMMPTHITPSPLPAWSGAHRIQREFPARVGVSHCLPGLLIHWSEYHLNFMP
jgi:hypothetical protein